MTNKRWLLVILAVGLLLRLAFALSQPQTIDYAERSGDSGWYFANGYALVTGGQPGDVPVYPARIGTPPLYLLLVGGWQALLPLDAAVLAVRLTQVLLSVALVFMGGRTAAIIAADERAGLVTAGLLALSPGLIVEAATLLSETLYLFFVVAGLWLFVRTIQRQAGPSALIVPALLLGLATLTRAVLLLFPLGLALHLLLVCGLRRGLVRAGVLLLVYSLTVSTWTIYNLARWDRLVIAGDGFAAFLYIGATGWESPEAVDERLSAENDGELPRDAASTERQEIYLEGAESAITADVGGYVRRRVGELASAYAQPHGTVAFSGESLRTLTLDWWRDDRTPGGLLALTQADNFWVKLSLYVWHYAGLVLGVVGAWLSRRRWRLTLLLLGLIAYTILLHLVLLALPRYLFPTLVIWWVFAGIALARWFPKRLGASESEREPQGFTV